jgi:predicted DCC family thiol-disulfide oxidoreductase YuxK
MSSTIPRLFRLEAVVQDNREDPQLLEVWMDGDCVLCRKSKAWCELRDPNGKLRFVDFRGRDENELPLALENHQKSMWVRESDGTLSEGFAAWRRILTQIPGWGWLARLTSVPPFSLIGALLYRTIAANRHRLRGG